MARRSIALSILDSTIQVNWILLNDNILLNLLRLIHIPVVLLSH